ncbi:hypothetical protein [Paracoccus methylarcula]|uniref:Helix-turn-helix domain-containing protein n=1 Tax=Paracoccus methylarcula TaxID=72022 RepID=A0A3R7LMZ1_9RHOB|nr:hypothetical protein [Paracoccus methylarcula]RNF32929.1 hypothetical protein A7A09_019135 [Paracoccus methylarcula]
MATFRHPVTGELLNRIEVRNTHLNEKQIETVRLLHQGGEDQHIIAAMLGINQGRINDVVGNPRDRRQGELI